MKSSEAEDFISIIREETDELKINWEKKFNALEKKVKEVNNKLDSNTLTLMEETLAEIESMKI